MLNIVHGYGPKAGAALCEHPDVPPISFTGGTVTGAKVAAAAAPLFKKLSLELGGKNPNADLRRRRSRRGDRHVDPLELREPGRDLPLRLAHLRRAVDLRRVRRALRRARRGSCASAIRSTRRRTSARSSAKPTCRRSSATSRWPRRRAARSSPAAIALDRPGYFLEPAVITGLGTRLPRAAGRDLRPGRDDHAVRRRGRGDRASRTPRATASRRRVWTRDLQRAHRVAAALHAGTVWINCWLLRDLRVPFGGMKESGVGREGGSSRCGSSPRRRMSASSLAEPIVLQFLTTDRQETES